MVNLIQNRLQQIIELVKNTGDAAAFLGLGSIGKENGRMDQYSDLDFFIIAKPGKKRRFIDNLDWLFGAGESDFYFKNSPDGYKFLYNDGVYCEFAVFENQDLENVPFSEGKFLWKDDSIEDSLAIPKIKSSPFRTSDPIWATGEMLTCLYVGMCRYLRGEKLSGTRFVQNFSVDILIASSHFFENNATDDFKDDYQNDRRIEKRLPDLSSKLPLFIQGYDKTPQSALEILSFIEQKFEVNKQIASKIRQLVSIA